QSWSLDFQNFLKVMHCRPPPRTFLLAHHSSLLSLHSLYRALSTYRGCFVRDPRRTTRFPAAFGLAHLLNPIFEVESRAPSRHEGSGRVSWVAPPPHPPASTPSATACPASSRSPSPPPSPGPSAWPPPRCSSISRWGSTPVIASSHRRWSCSILKTP